MTWNPAISGPQIDPHNTPYVTGSLEPTPPPYEGVGTSWNPSDSPGDPHDAPSLPADAAMTTGPVAANIFGGPLSDGRTAKVTWT
jgi:hypothetical protein